MGATIIIASRSIDKCLATTEDLRTKYPASAGEAIPRALDTSDLGSVGALMLYYTPYMMF